MVIANLTKGSRIEVSSDDAGFHGAWYVATFLDEVEHHQSKSKGSKHKSKKRKKVEYKVEYDSLVREDNPSEHLTENVDPSFVRPLAPRYPRRDNVNNEVVEAEAEAEADGGGDFELFDVVDADYLDGWWVGVVTKVIINGEKNKYIVSFESPAEEVEFERSQLRLHVDWIDGRWLVRPKKTPEQESAVRNAAQTSKSSGDAHLGFTKPSKGALMTDPATPTVGSQSSAKKSSSLRKVAVTHGDTVGEGALMTDPATPTVGSQSSAKKRSSSRKVAVTHGDTVGEGALMTDPATPTVGSQSFAKKRSSSRKVAVTHGDTVGEGALMTDPATPTVGSQSSAKKRSSSRKVAVTHGDTVGGPDHSFTYISNKRIVRNPHGKRFQSSSGSKGNTKVMVPVVEASRSQAEHQDSLLLEQETSITETCEAEAGESLQKRKRGRPPKSLIKLPNGLLQDNQESGKRVSSAIHEMTMELDKQPLSTWYQELHPMMVLKTRGSRCSALDLRDEPSDTLNPTIVNNCEITEYQQEWPFIKRSSMWATIESLELYQNPPQKPHFSQLEKVKEDFREGLAIAYWVTYANVVRKISKLKLDDPNDIIEDNLETLVDLETHGFDVGAIRARLNEFLSRKAKVGELRDKLKHVEEELEKQNLEKSKIDEEISQLEAKMEDLQEKLVESVKKKNVKDEEVKMLQSNLHLVANQIMDWKATFEKLAASPL